MFRCLMTVGFVAIGSTCLWGDDRSQLRSGVAAYLRAQHRSGAIVGAQVLVGSSHSSRAESIHIGQIAPDDSRPVSSDTLFGIGSCSKPIAAAVVFGLVDDGRLRLDQSIGERLPAFGSMTTRSGNSVRSPTVQELLAHRAGIYSQKQKITPLQMSAIRDFHLSLDESVAIIAKQKLLAPPGQSYAYSGAGYCVLGAVAQQAAGKPFERLLQQTLCEPLGMRSSTYFPTAAEFDEIANGGVADPNPNAPHMLADQLRLPLIGGSLYTTANDLGRFARMMIAKGRAGDKEVLSAAAWESFVSQPYPKQPYGNGWLLTRQNGKTIRLSHGGSLPPYQSKLQIDLRRQQYVIIHWTLANSADTKTMSKLQTTLRDLLRDGSNP